MVTDDARIVDAKACQVESWVKRNRDSTEYWALPGCNFTGNIEVTYGGARTSAFGATETTDVLLQVKTLFRTMEPGGWGTGLVLGSIRHPPERTDRRFADDLYAYVPTSFSFRGDRFVLHTNAGVLHERREHRHHLTWGVGGEAQLTAQSWLIAETYGQNEGRPFLQLGMRHWIVPNRVQVDVTYGNRIGVGSHWISVGLRLLSPPFLP